MVDNITNQQYKLHLVISHQAKLQKKIHIEVVAREQGRQYGGVKLKY
jgi:hypothetical protein